jgi:hypothetical protein
VTDKGVPFESELFEATVLLDELEEVLEATDEAELLRESVFRGANMPRTSSGFIELSPLMVPHAGLEI